MAQRTQCSAITKKGRRCKRYALLGIPYCHTHRDLIYGDKARKRRSLTRGHILRMIEENGSAEGLDLTFVDIVEAKLGSSVEEMPSLDGSIFGRYGAILSGANARCAIFQLTKMRKTRLLYGDFSEANFYGCDLSKADLRFAKFDGASMASANLAGANLVGASFSNTNFRGASLVQADLYLAKFSGATGLTRENVGSRLLQENAQAYSNFVERAILPDSNNPLESHLFDRYRKAAYVYRELRVHFDENGYLDDATWAFLKERRMNKIWSGQQAIAKAKQKEFEEAMKLGWRWMSDWFVEIVCDYGEGVGRVLIWLSVLLFVAGPTLIFISGGLDFPAEQLDTYNDLPTWQAWIYGYFQYLLFTLDTLTTSNNSALSPTNDLVRLWSGFLALIGIILAGLLGFVAGNRIHKV